MKDMGNIFFKTFIKKVKREMKDMGNNFFLNIYQKCKNRNEKYGK